MRESFGQAKVNIKAKELSVGSAPHRIWLNTGRVSGDKSDETSELFLGGSWHTGSRFAISFGSRLLRTLSGLIPIPTKAASDMDAELSLTVEGWKVE